MPGLNLHLTVARKCLVEWGQEYSWDDDDYIDHFNAGAIAPDIGYFSLINGFFSDLSHYIDSGDLVRNLWFYCETNKQRAFVAGWASHHRADCKIHPLINASVGIRFSENNLPMSFAAHPGYHVRVESGMDLNYLLPQSSFERCNQVFFSEATLQLIGRAFEKTYSIPFSIASFRRACWRAGLVIQLLRKLNHKKANLRFRRALAFCSTSVKNHIPFAFLHSIEPDKKLRRRIEELLKQLPPLIKSDVESDMQRLENLNLDTGEGQETPYPLSELCQGKLQRLRLKNS